MENFEKGSKRKCTKCGTLFFDFGKFPCYVLRAVLTKFTINKHIKKRKALKVFNQKLFLKKRV